MQRPQIVIPGNPGVVLARIAPTLTEWLGPGGCVLGGGTVLAARWQHRVSTDIDLFTDLERYQEAIVSQREMVVDALTSLVAETGDGSVEVQRGWFARPLGRGTGGTDDAPPPDGPRPVPRMGTRRGRANREHGGDTRQKGAEPHPRSGPA